MALRLLSLLGRDNIPQFELSAYTPRAVYEQQPEKSFIDTLTKK
jgi:hypothetical protein